MKRTFLALAFLVACGDDSSSDDDTTRDASPDAARDLLDAAVDAARPNDGTDARVDTPDAGQVVDASSPLDAQTPDASNASDAAQCVALDEQCDDTSKTCCENSACVSSSKYAFTYCAPTCSEPSECDTGCCTGVNGSPDVCAPAQYCVEPLDPTRPLTGINCFPKSNLQIFDGDKSLGWATNVPILTDDSVCNEFGPNGKNGATAINRNLWSIPGPAYQYPASSATLGCGTNFPILAYISKYKTDEFYSGTRVINLDDLCDVLKNSNL